MRDRPPAYLPRVPLWRRTTATAIDAVAVWLLASLLGAQVQGILFLILWLVDRVIIVANNRGQSLGRLAMDIKVLDEESRRIPTMLELAKREGLLGIEFLLALLGLNLLQGLNPTALLVMAPLAADFAVASADVDRRLAFHDRISGTMVVQTRRGFSLDLKVKRWYDAAQQYLQEARDTRRDRF